MNNIIPPIYSIIWNKFTSSIVTSEATKLNMGKYYFEYHKMEFPPEEVKMECPICTMIKNREQQIEFIKESEMIL